MKKLFLPILMTSFLFSFTSFAQDNALPDNFLFDDSDIIVTAQDDPSAPDLKTEENISDAVNSAKNILNQKPVKLRQQIFPKLKDRQFSTKFDHSSTSTQDAPFGLRWAADMSDTRNQGVELTVADMEDYVNCFLANKLPKPITFFDRVYVCFGQEDKLYRILAYSKLIDDDARASKVMHEYETYSDLLKQKYGNFEQDFTPATINKTIKNARGQDETVTENAPIGNPDFLSQLESGEAVLFSTYYNEDVAAALSIGVDGDKKSYIVIDYKNLQILKRQEADTLDAL